MEQQIQINRPDQLAASTMRICWEMEQKFDKLEKDFCVFGKEMAELRDKNDKLRKNFEGQIVALNDEVARLREENRILVWQMKNRGPMEETSICGENGAQNELEKSTNLNIQQNVEKNEGNCEVAIKREDQNVEENGEFGQQIQGNEQNGLENAANFGDEINVGNIDFGQIGNNSMELTAFGMEENGIILANQEQQQFVTSSSNEEGEGGRRIKCCPMKIGNKFKCNWPGCEFGLTHKACYIRRHWGTHTVERQFVCQKCGQSFKHLKSLNEHGRTHTGERPYQCRECGKTFNYMRVLTVHMRLHTGEKPYVCGECGDAFAQAAHLNSHKRTHAGKKGAYACEECGQAFGHLKELNAHWQTAHN